jgi:D-tyrosyl-tRNA(Tyr) deacylase
MNLSALETKAEIMVVSQFTLYADTRKGRRPAFTEAMEPQKAEKLYLKFIDLVRASGLKTVSGVFAAKMDISLTNHGPVTILLEHDL